MKTRTGLLLALVLLTAPAAIAGFIPADDKNFQYTGRIDFSNPKAPEFSWAGTSVRTKFTGTSLKVKFNEKGAGMYYVFIDGNYDKGHVIKCDQGEKTYEVATGLANKTHDLLIYKRTDGGKATTAFMGIELDKGAKLLAPGPRPKLKMEIFGDSISTGLGCDRARGKEHSREATDNFFAYGSVTARNIGAELHCISKSGIGMVKSWWPTIMPQYYDRLCATSLEGAGKQWDFSKWTPDLVVINLFQNDSWTIKKPDKAKIINAYVDFVKKIRGHYPKAKIVCALGSMSAGKNQWAGWVKESAKQLNDAGDKEVYSYIFRIGTGNRHPNKKDHAKMAEELTAFIKTLGLSVSEATPLPAETNKTSETKEVAKTMSVLTPDPSKKYYIDCPATGRRLSVDGNKAKAWGKTYSSPKAAEQSETGTSVEWKFVAVGDRWHIQSAAGGDESRLWAVKLPQLGGLALCDTEKGGGWTRFTVTDAGDGTCFLTAPDGPSPFQRLRLLDNGKISMTKANSKDASAQLVITEVGAKTARPAEKKPETSSPKEKKPVTSDPKKKKPWEGDFILE